jgi:hypothetical protein
MAGITQLTMTELGKRMISGKAARVKNTFKSKKKKKKRRR